jgi:hypothetical protein
LRCCLGDGQIGAGGKSPLVGASEIDQKMTRSVVKNTSEAQLANGCNVAVNHLDLG